jgi:hypothetical protein
VPGPDLATAAVRRAGRTVGLVLAAVTAMAVALAVPAAGIYVAVPWRQVVPSPDGTQAAVALPRRAGWALVPLDRVSDAAALRPIRESRGWLAPHWSGDGRRLAFPLPGRVASPARAAEPWSGRYLAVVDVATLAARRVLVRTYGAPRTRPEGRWVFGPADRGFASVPDGATVGLSSRRATGTGYLDLAAEDGTPLRTAEVAATGTPDRPFSPDGRLLLCSGRGGTILVDVASGAEVGSGEGAPMGWYDDEHYMVRVGSILRLVELGSGQVSGEWRLPSGDVRTVTVVRLVGPPPPGAIVL